MSTSRVDVGTPPGDFKGWTTTEVCYHGFANLPTTRNEKVLSPKFSCFGHQWVLKLYPGGEEDSEVGYVAVELVNRSNTSIKISYGYSVRDSDGKEEVHYEPDTNEFAAYGGGQNAWCALNFARRSKIIESLVNGSLVIEIRMKCTST